MAYDIGPRVGIDGEAQFRKEIQQITENIKTLGSEFKVVASAADAEGESIESLSKKNDILNRTVTELEKRLTAQRNMLDKSTQLYGEADSRTQKWQRTVNATETELNKLRGQINKNNTAMDKLESGTRDADDAMDDLGSAAESTGGKLSAMTVAMGNLIASGIQAAVSAVSNLVSSIWSLDESTEEFRQAQGRLNTAFENAGYSAETAEAAYDGFYSILGDTDRATEASQLLAQLAENEEDVATWTEIAAGVNGTFGDSLPIEGLIEAANETANVGTVTGVLADALNWVGISEDEFNSKLAECSTESERNALIMETLSGQYDEASEAFQRNNATLIEARENQAEMDRTMAQLGGTIANVKNQLTNALGPALRGIVDSFNALLTGEGSGESFGTALQQFIASVGELAPQVIQAGSQILGDIVQGILIALPQLLVTGTQIILELANGILSAIPQLVAQLPAIITEFINYISSELPNILQQGVTVLNNFVDGLIGAIPDFLAQLPQVITAFVDFIVSNLPTILQSGVDILTNLIQGIIGAIPDLVAALPQIIEAIVTGIGNLMGSILDVGRSIVEGIWQGITNAGSWLVGKITGWFDGVVGSVKRFLGINSPSRVFADQVGANMALGVGEGFADEMGVVERQLNRAMNGLVPEVSGNVSMSGTSAGALISGYDVGVSISRALNGAAVYMDGRKVGKLITRQQNNGIRAAGLVPTI